MLQRHLDDPRSQVAEMIRQVNIAKYYGDLFAGKDLTFVDLGANLGIVSLYAAPNCQRVLSVEAEPTTFSYLQMITEVFKQNECLNVALSPANAPVQIGVDTFDYSCHTVTNPKPGAKLLTIPGKTLQAILQDARIENVDVCKVDVEGAEMECLSLDVLRQAPVKCWYIEVHRTPRLTREQSHVVMTDRLLSAGFICSHPRSNAIIAKRP